jgi:hypothetical protein
MNNSSPNFQQDRAGRLGSGQHFGAVGFAIELEPIGQTNCHVFPAHAFSEGFFQLDNVNAWFDLYARFEPCFEIRLRCYNLFFDLPQTVAHREEHAQLKLTDGLSSIVELRENREQNRSF